MINKLVVSSFSKQLPLACHLKASLSTVAQKTVHVTFVAHDGSRSTVPGLEGQTVMDVARMHKLDLDGPCNGGGHEVETYRNERWTEPQYGEGPQCGHCRVLVPDEWGNAIDSRPLYEEKAMNRLWGNAREGVGRQSRLACMIKLTKELDGITVVVPDAPPVDYH
uniref:2Fe-2S ferredoxin-type domain-containing protein n=1 Tax=Fibrocapsa japonica TaxID=94617 RepID=A0A7S2V0K6_9STRA|mmetsp:Transcript_23292/g.33860  ORF Transcript_23292/g.33860 Transcript_23292/m.33860 type:complete len:165 (+) Transcript_23292:113-607(+)